MRFAIRRWLLILYALSVCFLCLWVPWHIQVQEGQARLNYGWVWQGPQGADTQENYRAQPDLPRIGLELLAVTSLASVGWLLTEPAAKPR